jgi:subfamily B ATP-binding cassette protein HlyB/CyaB
VAKAGHIKISNLSFRYGEKFPFLYRDLNIEVEPGKIMAVMGASGAGKSTLTKLLQGFYLVFSGLIKIDNNGIRHLSANELRSHFGVVL